MFLQVFRYWGHFDEVSGLIGGIFRHLGLFGGHFEGFWAYLGDVILFKPIWGDFEVILGHFEVFQVYSGIILRNLKPTCHPFF